MAQECTESSSSTPQNWWDLHHAATASSLSSWTNNTNSTPFWHQQNPNSNSSCDEETSFTNASNHSGLTVESARRMAEPAVASSNDHLIGEHGPDNHLWSHVLFNGDLQSSQDVGENLLEALSSKNMSSSAAMFEPACDYLKKMDNNIWDYTNSPSSFSNFEKHLNGFSHETLSNIEGERLTKLSNLVSNWSLAPPDPEVKFDTQTCNISLSPSINHYNSQQGQGNLGFLPCYGNEMKLENEIEAPGTFLRRPIIGNGIRYQMGLNSLGDNDKYYYGMNGTSPCADSARNFADVVSFNSRFGKPLMDIQVPKHCFKSLTMPHPKKQLQVQTSNPPTRTSGRSQGAATEGKKKRSDEETSETTLKKPKLENSSGASVKMHAPKVKLGDRITALQQIVSPFGKTDTASVLYEAIQYIKFLQEQVQLLSNPYTKTNSHKDPWFGMERKEKGDLKMELRSRGLCLVPISCTPQVYRDNTGSDFWTPTYRGFCIDKNY
ncbi:transcription factor bHLH [Tripterygium wilfordii]|uniref:Transcription factor bHLH n=1 Tax=Tripterygium wilfordii TaxID=458696 RepID=A0A7J7DUL2_TRIWF|nr:transcription factor bHLH111 [Tripterygium wilfordii]KAF5750045.1 transcription factor bHLH [Tripterygium wilfordii]